MSKLLPLRQPVLDGQPLQTNGALKRRLQVSGTKSLHARLYSEIEQRYENEQYYKVDGTPLTKEDEIEWLDIQFEQEVAWQKSCARITAQGQVIQGNIPEMPTEEMEELEDSFYQAKDAYMKLYRENRRAERPLVLQSYIFGNSQMYQILDRLGNLQERVV